MAFLRSKVWMLFVTDHWSNQVWLLTTLASMMRFPRTAALQEASTFTLRVARLRPTAANRPSWRCSREKTAA